MTESPGVLLTVLAFVGVIGPLIFIHEMGHYLVGRCFGVKAEAFSIGFGAELFGWTDRRGTRWRVAALPLGGYVKFAGDMNPAGQPTDEWLALPAEERARTFQAKPVWQRFLIVLAGPAINFLFAIVVFMGVIAVEGDRRTPSVVTQVVAGSAAAKAGIRPGDRITMIAGRDVSRFEDIVRIVEIRPNELMNLDVYRGTRQIHMTVTTGVDVQRDRFGNVYRFGLLGVGSDAHSAVALPWYEIPVAAVARVVDVVRSVIDTSWQIISGRRSVKELGGPLKIAQLSGEVATIGWYGLLQFATMISINLGFINLLPIPLLDGGHLLFYAIEGVRRRPLNAAATEWAFRSGLALLLGFMLFVTVNDLGSFGLWSRLAGLIG